MSKQENVVNYYVLCNKLKNVIRTGWKNWSVNRERVESVAEHIYGTQMLAIAMKSEFDYDIDIFKVIFMLAIHELEEIYIGDLTQFQISKHEKEKIGHEAVSRILDSLIDKKKIIDIVLEFDERKTKEAIFAYYCDKLECDLQCKIYDEENCVDINNQDENKIIHDVVIKKLLQEGKTWSKAWITFDQNKYNYDDNFNSICNYIKDNDILK